MNPVIHPSSTVWGGAKLIGNVLVDAHAIVDDMTFIYAPDGFTITIGRRVHIASFVSISGGAALLSDYSSVGPGSRLLVASDDFLGSALVGSGIPPRWRNVKRRAIVLEKHAVIGANCVIMPGVTIGEGACVGANSLVTRDVPPWTIVGGSPARHLKDRPRGSILEMQAQLELYDAKEPTV